MSQAASIRSFMVPPPGGEYFCMAGYERIACPDWHRFRPVVEEFMAKHGVSGSPESFVAACMCPYMPDWYCRGVFGSRPVRMDEARRGAEPYFPRPVVAFDVVQRRLARCESCPRHSRSFCMTCTGILPWLCGRFGGRRVKVPEDTLAGMCECARTFASVVASVEFGEEEPCWEGIPETCWRNGDDR